MTVHGRGPQINDQPTGQSGKIDQPRGTSNEVTKFLMIYRIRQIEPGPGFEVRIWLIVDPQHLFLIFRYRMFKLANF